MADICNLFSFTALFQQLSQNRSKKLLAAINIEPKNTHRYNIIIIYYHNILTYLFYNLLGRI